MGPGPVKTGKAGKKILGLALALIVLLAIQGIRPAEAAVSVTLQLDRPQAEPDTSVLLTVTLSGTRKTDANPVIRGLQEFHVASGGTSSFTEFINRKVSSRLEYKYYLQPKKAGTFRIGPAVVNVDGKIYQSNVVTLSVKEGVPAPDADRGALFLESSISKIKVYAEEQILYTLKLYVRTRVSDISLELPEMDHLAFKQLDQPRNYQGTYHGRAYQVLEVHYSLIPSKAGVYGLPPARMRLTVYESRRGSNRGLDSFFNSPFFSTGTPKTVSGKPYELEVMPLPETGRPADFSGLVGEFKLDSTFEPTKIQAGDSATLTVRLSGRGNVSRLPELQGPELEGVKSYADEPALETSSDAAGLTGSKVMKWALVPEKEGSYSIPPISVSYFNPENRAYHSLQTRPYQLTVLPGTTARVPLSMPGRQAGTVKQEVKELGHDILPVHTSLKNLGSDPSRQPGGLFALIILAAPLLAYAVVFVVLRVQHKALQSNGAGRARKAAKKFSKRLQREEFDLMEFGAAFREYLNERFTLSLGVLTPLEAARVLEDQGVGPETIARIKELLLRVEDEMYSGRQEGRLFSEQDLREIPRLIGQIEKDVG